MYLLYIGYFLARIYKMRVLWKLIVIFEFLTNIFFENRMEF